MVQVAPPELSKVPGISHSHDDLELHKFGESS